MPGIETARAMEPDMAAMARQQRRQARVPGPVEAQIRVGWNPGIVERMDHQRRHADAVHEADRRIDPVIVISAAPPVARRYEPVIELVALSRTPHDRPVMVRDRHT